MNYPEASIQIELIEITPGEIVITGTVEGTPLVYRVDESMKDYEKFANTDSILSIAEDELYEQYIKTL